MRAASSRDAAALATLMRGGGEGSGGVSRAAPALRESGIALPATATRAAAAYADAAGASPKLRPASTRDARALHALLGDVMAAQAVAMPGAPMRRVIEGAAAGMTLGDARAAAYEGSAILGADKLNYMLLQAAHRWLLGRSGTELHDCLGSDGSPYRFATAAAHRVLRGPANGTPSTARARAAIVALPSRDVPALAAAFVRVVAGRFAQPRKAAGAPPAGKTIPACPLPAPEAEFYCDTSVRGALVCAADKSAWASRVAAMETLLRDALGDEALES